MHTAPQAVLFDLDGTLIDTAPDLANALNHTLQQHHQNPLSYNQIRPVVSYGALGLLKLGFNIQPSDPTYPAKRAQLLDYYRQHLCQASTLFPGMPAVLAYLGNAQIRWGVVTNKPGWLTKAIDR